MAKRKTIDYEINRLKNWDMWDEEYNKSLPIEDVEITSHDTFKIKGHLIENHKDNNKYVILVHGYSAHYSIHMPFVKMFQDMDFNVLLVEQRAHGDSEGIYTSYGYNEAKDLNLWIEFLEKRRGEKLYIGLHGQSMGAAAVMICGAHNDKVKFVVEDCGYFSAKEQIKYEFSKTKYAFFTLVYWYLKIKCKFNFEEADPMREILKSNVPIFFVHGDKDKKVPYEMCLNMYNKRHGVKDKILIVKDAGHLESYYKEPFKYTRAIKEFLNEI